MLKSCTFYLYNIPEWFFETLAHYNQIQDLLIRFNLHQPGSSKRLKPTLPLKFPNVNKLVNLTLDVVLEEEKFDISSLDNLEKLHIGYVSGDRYHSDPIVFPNLEHSHLQHLVIEYHGKIILPPTLGSNLPCLRSIELLVSDISPFIVIKQLQ